MCVLSDGNKMKYTKLNLNEMKAVSMSMSMSMSIFNLYRLSAIS